MTQKQIDTAYKAGKSAYLRDIGTHGPTLRPMTVKRTRNPHPDGLLALAWDRGYQQDCRRVIAPLAA